MSRRLVLPILLLAAAGCGGGDGTAEKPQRTTTPDAAPDKAAAQPSKCRSGRTVGVNALEKRITVKGKVQLVRVFHSESADAPSPQVAGFGNGVYVVSGQLKGGKAADGERVTWAVPQSTLVTGKGPAVPLDDTTRKLTGSAGDAGSPKRRFADAVAQTGAYKQARACVRVAAESGP